MRIPTIRIVRDDGLGESNPAFDIDGRRWRLAQDGLEGFDGLEHEVSSQDYAQYDGAYLLSERTGTKDRTVSAVAFGDPAALRAEAEAFFIPGRQYEVHVEVEGRRRFFYARQYAVSFAVDTYLRSQLVTWTCLAMDPCVLSEDEKRFDLVEAEPRRGFPFVSALARVVPLPDEDGQVPGERHVRGFAVGVLSNRIRLENDGASTAYPRFDVTASGDVEDPEISIVDGSGQTVCDVSFDLSLKAGDELVLDFSARPTSILLNGANASTKVRPGSTLAAGIEPGSFDLVWSASSGDAALSIKPSIRERYLTI